MQESFCIGIAGYFCLYYAFHYKEFRGIVRWIVIGFCLGAAICILAPANFVRLSNTDQSFSVLRYVKGVVTVVSNVNGFIILVVMAGMMAINKRIRPKMLSFFRAHGMMIVIALISCLFATLIVFNGHHQLFSVEVYCLLIIVCAIYQGILLKHLCWEKYLNVFAAVVLLGLAVPVEQTRTVLSNAYKEFLENAKRPHDGIVVAETYLNLATQERTWIDRFAYYGDELSWTPWPSSYLSRGKSPNLIKVVLPTTPSRIISSCQKRFEVGNMVYKHPDQNFYIVRLPKGQENGMLHIERKVTWLGSLHNKRRRGSPLFAEDREFKDYRSFEDGNYTYYIVLDVPALGLVKLSVI